jgi:hypothetical protein
MSKQITVRGVTPELSRRLKRLSSTRGESLNTTVLSILQQAAGIDERRKALARYATWTKADLHSFEEALRAQRTVDAELWK